MGFAVGGELEPYLRWRRLPVRAAVRAGLLDLDGREHFRGRIVWPELSGGRPVWMIGRAHEQPDGQRQRGPKYLGLPGLKPLVGWEEAVRDPARTVCVVEGPLDWLTLRAWGVTAIALAGTAVRPEVLERLDRLDRVYVALDWDAGGEAGTALVLDALGPKARRVPRPDAGVGDVAELAPRPDGRDAFLAALRAAESSDPSTRHGPDP